MDEPMACINNIVWNLRVPITIADEPKTYIKYCVEPKGPYSHRGRAYSLH
jgi:hypothetical protein